MKQTMKIIFSLNSLILLVLNVQVITISNIPKSLAAFADPVEMAPVSCGDDCWKIGSWGGSQLYDTEWCFGMVQERQQ